MNDLKKTKFRKLSSFSKREFDYFKSNSRFLCSHDNFVMRMSRYPQESARILISIPKKCGHAPQRNYLRRCVKENFYALYDKFAGYDYAIFFKKAPCSIDFHLIKKFFCDILIKKSF